MAMLTGRCTLSSTGEPLSATVRAFLAGSQVAETVADRDGRYHLSLPPGEYQLRAFLEGYAPAAARASLQTEEVTLNLALPPSCQVHGRVLEAGSGRPLAEATVVISRKSVIQAQTKSNRDGHYRLDSDLPEDHYQLRVVSQEHLPLVTELKLAPASITELDLELTPSAEIVGNVKFKSGGFSENATITATQPGAEPVSAPVGPGGRYQVFLASGGTVCVTALAPACHPVSVELQARLGETTAADFVLTGTGQISGQVLDSSGKPLAGAQMAAVVGRRKEAAARTDHQGHFLLAGIPGGTYEVQASHPQQGVTIQFDLEVGDAPAPVVELTMPGTPLEEAQRRITPWQELSELWEARQLLGTLISRELRNRYKESVLGLVWSLLIPLAQIAVFTVAFQYIMPPRQMIRDYSIFLFCGLLVWNFFLLTIMDGCHSVLTNRPIISKLKFPKIALPLATVAQNFINFLLTLAVFWVVILIKGYHFYTYPPVVLLPLLVLFQLMLQAGLVLMLAPLNTLYQDVAYIVTVILQFGFFLTPILYTIQSVQNRMNSMGWPDGMLSLYLAVNPLATLVESYRRLFLNNQWPQLKWMIGLGIEGVILLVLGYLVFRRWQWRVCEEV